MRFPLLVLVGTIAVALPIAAADRGPFHPSSVEVYFSPKGGATEACVAAIAVAKTTISVQAYSFTSSPIAAALLDHERLPRVGKLGQRPLGSRSALF